MHETHTVCRIIAAEFFVSAKHVGFSVASLKSWWIDELKLPVFS